MFDIRVTEEKNEKMKEEDKMRISILIFIYIVHFAYLKVYTKLNTSLIGYVKSVTEISIGE